VHAPLNPAKYSNNFFHHLLENNRCMIPSQDKFPVHWRPVVFSRQQPGFFWVGFCVPSPAVKEFGTLLPVDIFSGFISFASRNSSALLGCRKKCKKT
jgi:hypothetical protein